MEESKNKEDEITLSEEDNCKSIDEVLQRPITRCLVNLYNRRNGTKWGFKDIRDVLEIRSAVFEFILTSPKMSAVVGHAIVETIKQIDDILAERDTYLARGHKYDAKKYLHQRFTMPEESEIE